MNFSMSMSQSQCYERPATESIFPAVRRKLRSAKAVQSLQWLAGDDLRLQYRDLIDLLYAELFDQQEACFAFYADEGQPLRLLSDKDQLTQCVGPMIRAIELAKHYSRIGQRVAWTHFKRVWKSNEDMQP